MENETIFDRVKQIIEDTMACNPDGIMDEARFVEDLGADSLDTVELTMNLEQEFGVEVPDEDIEKLQTVGDVVKYLQQATGEV